MIDVIIIIRGGMYKKLELLMMLANAERQCIRALSIHRAGVVKTSVPTTNCQMAKTHCHSHVKLVTV